MEITGGKSAEATLRSSNSCRQACSLGRRGYRDNPVGNDDLTTPPFAMGLEATWGFMSWDVT